MTYTLSATVDRPYAMVSFSFSFSDSDAVRSVAADAKQRLAAMMTTL